MHDLYGLPNIAAKKTFPIHFGKHLIKDAADDHCKAILSLIIILNQFCAEKRYYIRVSKRLRSDEGSEVHLCAILIIQS